MNFGSEIDGAFETLKDIFCANVYKRERIREQTLV